MNIVSKSAVLGLIAALFSLPAKADNIYRPYVGMSYAYTAATAHNFHPHNNSVLFNLGSTYNPYFSTELFYQYSGKDELSSQGKTKNTSFNAYGLDVVSYLPLKGIAPLATMGIGEYGIKNKLYQGHHSDKGLGYRFGAGLQYNFANGFATRLTARYIKTDKLKNYNHLSE